MRLGRLTALLWGGVVGYAVWHQRLVKRREPWQREDAAVRSLGDC
jgi:hypothetical protein